MVQWAAAHWQLKICQLLLAKGADVEARNWGGLYTDVTPLGIACASGDYKQFTFANFRQKHATDTLDLLLESGLDTHASVEVDYNLYFLSEYMSQGRGPHSIRRAVARQFSWLVRKYIQATTCDGLLVCSEPHPEAFVAIRVSEICFTGSGEFWNEERSGYGPLAHMDIQTFQSFWLYLIAGAAVNHHINPDISPQFCRAYGGDFHYRQSWDFDGHKGRDSPMQLALRSFAALGTFRSILTASGTDIVKFTEKESTMPWCNHSKEALMSLFSLQSRRYKDLAFLFDTTDTCRRCFRKVQREARLDWKETVESVTTGDSFASLLLESLLSEQEAKRRYSVRYCEACKVDMQTSR